MIKVTARKLNESVLLVFLEPGEGCLGLLDSTENVNLCLISRIEYNALRKEADYRQSLQIGDDDILMSKSELSRTLANMTSDLEKLKSLG